ncbi:MAG: protein kinase [Planctomycetaceae bacterium]
MSERAPDSRADVPDQRDSQASHETLPPRTFPDTAVTAPVGKGSNPEGFGRYRIVGELGHGAMGTVYLADDTELGRQVALKIPRFFAQEGSEFKERFYREARAAATLNHRNICAVYDIGEIDGTPYMTMAYIDGRPLTEYVQRRGGVSEAEMAAIVRKLAVTLQEAHDKSIIHRDLKPANILVDGKNEPVVMDFGLARRMDGHESVRITHSGELIGSPAYMSPEQVEGNLESIGPASDVYSLGVIFYELLTGELPFRGSVAVVLGQIATCEPDPPSERNPAIDPRLEAICLKMIAKKIDDRYQSMDEVAVALDQYLESPEPLTDADRLDESLIAELGAGSLVVSGTEMARGLALLALVIVDFRWAAAESAATPGWLLWLVERLDGRAAACFVILMGMGFSFLSQRARRTEDAIEIRNVRRRTLNRAAILFMIGYLYYRWWPGDLLHYCGVYLAIGTLLITASGRALWTFAILLVVFFPGLFIGFDVGGLGYFEDWNRETHEYIGSSSAGGVVRNLFFNGYQPVIPWAAFFIAGMWLGRLNLRKRAIQYRLFWIGLSVALAVELLSALNVMILGRVMADDPEFDYRNIRSLFGSTPWPPLPVFMSAAGSAAVAMIAACLIVSGRRIGARVRESLATAGRMAITLYVTHVVVGMGLLDAMGRLGGQTLGFAVTSALICDAALLLCAMLWSRRFRRGPLEWLISKAGG